MRVAKILRVCLNVQRIIKSWKYWATVKKTSSYLISPDLKSFASLKREITQAAGDFPVIKTSSWAVEKQHQQTFSHLPIISSFLLEWLSQKPKMSSYLLTIVTDISAWLRHPLTDTLCSEMRKTAEGLEMLTKKWIIIFYSPFDNLANLWNSFVIQNSLYCHVEYYVIV